jgi:hypothetical protein
MFESIMLISFIVAVLWAWYRQSYVYECVVCKRRMRRNYAVCSDDCSETLWLSSYSMEDYK